ncbi:MAG: nucleoside triphosphate pyrophosphohydrolase [Candidatus Dadabacteria bacterium]|nr:MAG: nucleoside triphosphate pyrophosphohydrolase [Candidatus Dadabacteria bacterium]
MPVPTPQEKLAEVLAAPPGMRRLEALMRVLRGPGGCPWDHEQTHQSLSQYLIEEAWELVDAIASGDDASLKEELGDVLLQVVFHAQIARERGAFDLDDIAEAETRKMIERHPHVFADVAAETPDDVRDQWEARKRASKEPQSLAHGVPRAMPALTRALTISQRAASLGFDWVDLQEMLPKLDEEVQELREAIAAGDSAGIHEEIGDLLFAVVNAARLAGVDPEQALRDTTDKFVRRFDLMERPTEPRSASEDARQAWDRAYEQAHTLERAQRLDENR